MLTYQFVFFCFQLFVSFLKIAFFKEGVQILGFSILGVFSSNIENSLFLICKNTIKIGVSAIVGVFVVEREEIGKKKKDN